MIPAEEEELKIGSIIGLLLIGVACYFGCPRKAFAPAPIVDAGVLEQSEAGQ